MTYLYTYTPHTILNYDYKLDIICMLFVCYVFIAVVVYHVLLYCTGLFCKLLLHSRFYPIYFYFVGQPLY